MTEEDKIRKRNIECKPPVKGKSVKFYLGLHEQLQEKVMEEDPGFEPQPVFVERHGGKYRWKDMLNVVTSAPFKGRFGRGLTLYVIDRRHQFLYGFVQLNSPTINTKVSDYMKEKMGRKTLDIDQINHEMVEMSVCVGLGEMRHYLSGKMLVYMTLSEHVKRRWDRRYKTDLKYIFTTSLYGKSSIYNRIKPFKYLGKTEGLNCLFSEEEVRQMNEMYEELFPGKPLSKNKDFPGGNRIFRMYSVLESHYRKTGEEDKLPERMITPRGVYIYDSDDHPWESLKEQIGVWKKRWYFPRKERIEKE